MAIHVLKLANGNDLMPSVHFISFLLSERILGDYLTMPGLGLCQIPLIAKLHSDPFGEKIICNSLHQLKMFAQFLPKVIYP